MKHGIIVQGASAVADVAVAAIFAGAGIVVNATSTAARHISAAGATGGPMVAIGNATSSGEELQGAGCAMDHQCRCLEEE